MYLDGILFIGFVMTVMIGMLLVTYGVYNLYEALVARKFQQLDIARIVIEIINTADRLICSLDNFIASRTRKRRSTLEVDDFIMKTLRNNS